MVDADDLTICVACSTQFEFPLDSPPQNCKICEDPRQYIPPDGQQWTSMRKLKEKGTKNVWKQDAVDGRIWSITIEPKVGIGQRAMLLQTEHGNILWDLIAYLDDETISKINAKGGLKAIVISHPHFYSTHLEWAKAFACPVYLSAEEQPWLCRADDCEDDAASPHRRFLTAATTAIAPGVTAIKCGGHFPGSLVLHWARKLFVADTLMTVPAGLYAGADRPRAMSTYAFMWSIPNMIPLPPDAVLEIWRALERWEFVESYGLMVGMDVRDARLKERVLESMKIQVGWEGWGAHELMRIEL